MALRESQFIRNWIAAFVGSVLFVALFNAIIDPYLLLDMPRLQGVNARKPAVDANQRLMKAYDVFRIRPRTLVLGSSRAEVGIGATSEAWETQERPVYNLGFAAGGPYMAYRYLQHVLSRQDISTVVLGLEFEYFLKKFHAHDYDFESHLLVARDGSPNLGVWMRLRDVGNGLTSLNAFSDSLNTFTENLLATSSSDMRSGNWDWSALSVTHGGTYEQFTSAEVILAPLYDERELDTRAFDAVSTFLDICESHHIRAIIFISPSHTDLLELIHISGSWPVFKQWLRELTAVVSRHTQIDSRDSPPLWDFTGYLPYAEESILIKPREFRWFLNPDHYSKELGDLIIRRMLGTGDDPFGQMLTPGNVESHIQSLDRQRKLYLQEHQADASRVRKLYEIATGRSLLSPQNITQR